MGAQIYRRLFLGVASIACITVACASREAAWEKPQPVAGPDNGVLLSEMNVAAEAAWSNRAERASLEEAIQIWEQWIDSHPADAVTLARLARAYFLLGDAFMLPGGENGQSMQTFDKGTGAAERAMMAVSAEFAALVNNGADVEAALVAIPPEGQEALFWYASNLGRFISFDMTTAALYTGRIFAVADRVLELGPSFFYAAPHRYLGSLYAMAPPFMGGDLEKAKLHFERALQIAPDYLDTKVLYAEFYAPKVEDKELFERLLVEVVRADPESLPGIAPEQRMAQSRAKDLLEDPDEIF